MGKISCKLSAGIDAFLWAGVTVSTVEELMQILANFPWFGQVFVMHSLTYCV